jgi:hypothetical protein
MPTQEACSRAVPKSSAKSANAAKTSKGPEAPTAEPENSEREPESFAGVLAEVESQEEPEAPEETQAAPVAVWAKLPEALPMHLALFGPESVPSAATSAIQEAVSQSVVPADAAELADQIKVEAAVTPKIEGAAQEADSAQMAFAARILPKSEGPEVEGETSEALAVKAPREEKASAGPGKEAITADAVAAKGEPAGARHDSDEGGTPHQRPMERPAIRATGHAGREAAEEPTNHGTPGAVEPMSNPSGSEQGASGSLLESTPALSSTAAKHDVGAAREMRPTAQPVQEIARAPLLEAERPAAQASGAARDISVRVQGPGTTEGGTPVDLRLQDRGGELRVSVRTADPALTQGLRESISDLTGNLGRGGFQAEVWSPREAASSSQANSGAESRGRGSQEQQGQQRQGGRERENQPKWVEEMEASFTAQQSERNQNRWSTR